MLLTTTALLAGTQFDTPTSRHRNHSSAFYYDFIKQRSKHAAESQTEKERSVDAAVEFGLNLIFKKCVAARYSFLSADIGCANHPSAKQ